MFYTSGLNTEHMFITFTHHATFKGAALGIYLCGTCLSISCFNFAQLFILALCCTGVETMWNCHLRLLYIE